MASLTLSCTGMKCPAPLIEVWKKVKEMEQGDTLEVHCDDPAFCEDMKAWCTMSGNQLIRIETTDSSCTVVIERAR